jgi:hypothetical protein
MRHTALAVSLAAIFLMVGCAGTGPGARQTPQEAIAEIRANGGHGNGTGAPASNGSNNYELAYMECQAMAAQITGPNGNPFMQTYYLGKCLKAKGY